MQKTYIHLFKASKNKGEYTKNALKREFKRLALCKKTPEREKSNVKNLHTTDSLK